MLRCRNSRCCWNIRLFPAVSIHIRPNTKINSVTCDRLNNRSCSISWSVFLLSCQSGLRPMHPPAMHPSAPGLLPTSSMAVQIPTSKVNPQNTHTPFVFHPVLWGQVTCILLVFLVNIFSISKVWAATVFMFINVLLLVFLVIMVPLSFPRLRSRALPRALPVIASCPTAKAGRGFTTTASRWSNSPVLRFQKFTQDSGDPVGA